MEGARTDRVEIWRGAQSGKWSWRYVRGNGVILAAGSAYVRRSAALEAACTVIDGTANVTYGAENAVHGWIQRKPLAPGLPARLVEVVQR